MANARRCAPAADKRRRIEMSAVPQALKDLKVVEFGGYAAGPHVGKMLANYGAIVIHVESRDRPDGFRMQYPPYKDDIQGIERSGTFALYNDSKFGVTINLKKEGGQTLARRLCDWADVIVENMRPGVMARLGLSAEALMADHPELIYLSTCNMGQTGPRADTPGFGSQLSALAGFCGLTGTAEGSPMLLYGPYIDFVASNMGMAAVLAALDRRKRTGQGCVLDQSQYESGLVFVAGAVLDYEANGVVAQRQANRDRVAIPHNVFPCADAQWLALSCWSDSEFAALAGVIGRPELAADRRFSSVDNRRANVDELDRMLAAWCVTQPVDLAATALQAADVAAYPVQTISRLFEDPQLVARRTWRTRRHPEIGDQAYLFPGFDLPDTPGDIVSPAPLLGGDNEKVFRGFLDMTGDEYEALCAQGIID